MRLCKKHIAATAVLVCSLVFAMCSCTKTDQPLNLVLITVDTLRPDRLGYNGANRPTSPAIDALAADGVVFTNAYSQSGWTLPSIATILTGHYPKDHGATDFHWSLDATLPTLPGILRRAGYDTRGYVSHVMLTPTYGIGGGFAEFDYSVLDVGHPHDVSTAEELTQRALRGLGRAEKPFFLWVHYFDPHFAYLPHPATMSWGNSDADRYDGEIAHTDRHLSRLLRALDMKNTVVVFTADHGEEFGEHGGKYHYTMHDEVMRVPLVIVAPGLTHSVNETQVDQTDLLPTILSLLGMEVPEGLPGRDILAAGVPDHALFIERDRPPPWRQQGIIVGSKKLFVVETGDTASIPVASRGTEIPVRNVKPGIYFYDLARDPGEKTNLYSDDNAEALELLGRVAEHFATRRYQENAVELDPDLVKKLKSLGYIR